MLPHRLWAVIRRDNLIDRETVAGLFWTQWGANRAAYLTNVRWRTANPATRERYTWTAKKGQRL